MLHEIVLSAMVAVFSVDPGSVVTPDNGIIEEKERLISVNASE